MLNNRSERESLHLILYSRWQPLGVLATMVFGMVLTAQTLRMHFIGDRPPLWNSMFKNLKEL